MQCTPRPRLRSALGMVLQLLGVLGTSHCLDALIRHAPGYATSRIALAHAAGTTANAPWPILAIRDVLIPAGLEELLFRGLVFGLLQRRLGTSGAIVGSALLFGLAHLDPHQASVAAMLGLQLGALRARFGLGLAVAAHAANNAAALVAAATGLESSASSLTLAALLSGSAWAALAQRREPRERARAVADIGLDALQRGTRSDESA